MALTFDTSQLESRLAAVAAALPAALLQRVPEAAVATIENSGYAEPAAGESGTIDPADLVTDVTSDGAVATVGIIQLYDWVLEPDAIHCKPTRNYPLTCEMIAAAGPYTLESVPAQPGDGTTPCHQNCKCQFLPREPILAGDMGDALSASGADVFADLASAWGNS